MPPRKITYVANRSEQLTILGVWGGMADLTCCSMSSRLSYFPLFPSSSCDVTAKSPSRLSMSVQ